MAEHHTTEHEVTATTMIIRPWPDHGLGERVPAESEYVELFWLGVLGPTATWLLRRLAAGLDSYPDGYELDLETTAASLGTTYSPGRHGPFTRAIDRCVLFGMAERSSEQGRPALAVRRVVPLLPARRVDRLPTALREAHADWTASRRQAQHA